jgi:hypothetical protein
LIDPTKWVWQFNNGDSLSLPSYDINFYADKENGQLLEAANNTRFLSFVGLLG